MNELFLFMNKQALPQYDLLKVAIAHHRFMWIHPFGNGNGRTGRLFTYAMLIKLGFKVDMAGRILNPTAVFCVNRNDYYKYLALADSGKKEENLQWCEYVLKGLKEEIEKVDRLTDYSFLSKEILLPSVEYSLERKIITEIEFRILKRTIEKRVIKSGDLKDIFVNKASSEISRQIRKLLDRKMLNPLKDGSRTYTIGFNNNYLLRGIIKLLGEKGFLPIKE
jgi:Fic family protein